MATKKKQKSKSKKKAGSKKPSRVEPIPKGMHTVTASLVVQNADRAIEFYKNAFGAKELYRMPMPDGKTIMHAELKIGDTILMINDEFPEMGCKSPQSIGSSSVSFYIYVKDVDKVFDNAVAAGSTATMPVMDAFWGDRMGQIKDPFGHVWSLATRTRNVSPKEMKKAGEEFFKNMPTGGPQSGGSQSDTSRWQSQ